LSDDTRTLTDNRRLVRVQLPADAQRLVYVKRGCRISAPQWAEAWRLLCENQAASQGLEPYPADLMRAYPVGQRIRPVRNNDPALLDPLLPAV
jgi:putative SOS response-associated peptidase YedK